MILRALYDYYHRCSGLPLFGTELKEIGFLVKIGRNGEFLGFEDRRIDKKSAQQFLVKKSVGRSSGVLPNLLYDNSQYVFGYMPDKGDMGKMHKYMEAFKEKVDDLYLKLPNHVGIRAVHEFYQQSHSEMIEKMQADPIWTEIEKNLNKKYSIFSFLVEGETEIVASQMEILECANEEDSGEDALCLVTGHKARAVEVTTATMIPGSQATAKLVAFQVNSGYDSYGKEKGGNAPISENAEFAYTTALNHLLRADSRNKFLVGSRTFLFWSSSDSEAAKAMEENIFMFLGRFENLDDPNKRIELVRQTFMSIYDGKIPSVKDDRFFILGLAPNSARIAVVYWAELPLREFAGIISQHFADMQIADTRKEKRPYAGLHAMLGAVSLEGKPSNASPNLPDAVIKSIFQGLPYPDSLYQACIRRIRAEQSITITRAAIIKAYLNRKNNKKLNIMLDKENQNQGYLCGRLFAALDKIQEDANGIHSVRERYLNSASATPATIFPTILNLSVHHVEKLATGKQVFYEKLKQEIISKLNADGFPSNLDLQDQGRFFVGYYHQRQDFFTAKSDETVTE